MPKAKYPLEGAIAIHVGDNRYYAWIDKEVVVREVHQRNGRVHYRRVKSWNIETAALLKASDALHAAP